MSANGIAEALQFTAELQQKATQAAGKVAVVPLPAEPAGVYGLVTPDGSFEKVTAEPHPRAHTLASIDQVVPFVASALARFAEGVAPSVWYSQAGITILLTDAALETPLQHKAVVPLKPSPEFLVLLERQQTERPMAAKQFLFWLRTKLGDAVRDLDQLLPVFRNLKFAISETGHQRVAQGRESLGREVDANAGSEAGDVPETLVCEIRIFTDPAIKRRTAVRCAVDVDPRSGEILLVPLAGELDSAVDDELQAIGQLLTSSLQVPVFYGTP